MSFRLHLQVTDLTGTFRGAPDQARPVHVGHDGTRVVLMADQKHAQLLARIVSRVASSPLADDDIDQVLWDHVVVDLLAAAAMAGGTSADQATATGNLEVVR